MFITKTLLFLTVMKNLFLCIACLFVFNGFGQEFQSLELPKTNIERFKPIGENNGYLYYFMPENKSRGVKVEVFKIKESTMELTERKELEFDIAGMKTFVNHDNSPMDVYFKNNKFYFFYCLVSSGDFHINLTTTDENFNNPKTTELGVMVETGYEGLGFYNVDISPDGKSAIIALKNKCERKKAIGTNTNVNYENTELVYVDLISEKIVYSKKLPLEMDDMRVLTRNYITDNEGNITFVAMISKREKDMINAINGIAIGTLNKNDEKMKITEVDTKGSTSVLYSIYKNKQNDVLYSKELDNSCIYKQVMNDKNKQNVEFTIMFDKFKKENFEKEAKDEVKVNPKYAQYAHLFNRAKDLTFLNVHESSNGYFAFFYHQKNINNYHKFSVAFLSKIGEIIWHKSLPYIPTVYKCNYGSPSELIYNNNKMYFFFNENKPYEITKKINKILDNDGAIIEYDHKKENTVMISVDEKGIIDKKIVNDNLIGETAGSASKYNNNLYLKLWNEKNKSVTLKKIPLK